MRTWIIFQLLFAAVVISSCGHSSKTVAAQNKSVVVQGITGYAFLDGLPDNVDIDRVNKALIRKIEHDLASYGLAGNTGKIITAKYDITYFGHKYYHLRIQYVMKYRLELIDSSNDKVIYSSELDASDPNLDDMAGDISKDIIRQVLKYKGTL